MKKRKASVHCRRMGRNMFEHLASVEIPIDDVDAAEFVPLEAADVADVTLGQAKTADWLDEIGAPDDKIHDTERRAVARQAFLAVTTGSEMPPAQKTALLRCKGPKAVQHLTSMLDAYDWEFVEQAAQIRGYVTAKILEETKNPDAKVRLKALEMLGKVSEIGLFEERIKVTKVDATAKELEEKIKERLKRWIPAPAAQPVEDITPKPDA